MLLAYPEQTLLGFLKLDPNDDAEATLRELEARDTNWDQVRDAALRHGLGPLLYAKLRKVGAHDLPASFLEPLKEAYWRALAGNILAYDELNVLLRLLQGEGVAAIVLKGAALAGTVYPNIALRPMGDVDLLVRTSQVSRAKEVLIGRGYVSYLELAVGFNQSFGQAATFTRRIPYPMGIDFHWHLLGWPYYRKDVPPTSWFWDSALERRVAGRPALVLSPEGQILHLTAHLAFHHRWQRLIWFYDIAQVIKGYENDLDWDAIIAKAKEFEILRALQVTLNKTVALFAPPIPSEAFDRLESTKAGLREKVVFAFMTARDRHAAILLSLISEDSLLRKARFLATVAFPSSEYMFKRYQLSDRRKLPLYYAYRLGRGLYWVLSSLFFVLCRALDRLKH